ncbi:MAG: GreA/GreB family elongation factor [Chloroflexota bacterium]
MNEQVGPTQSGGTGAPGPVQLTRSGIAHLQQTVRGLREMTRPQILARVRQGQLFMDPVRGAETTAAARQDLAAVDRQIAEFDALLASAQIVGDGPAPNTVQIGFPVTVRDADGNSQTLTIVSSPEADPARGLIDSESPVGTALLGKAPATTTTVGDGKDALALTVVSIATAEMADGARVTTEEA